MSRIVIVGGPRCGKSWLARELRKQGIPTFCGDPESEAKDVEPDVTYLPEGLEYAGDDGAAAWVSANWMLMPGPWCLESHCMARALLRWLNAPKQYGSAHDHFPCDRVIVFTKQRHDCDLKRGQLSQHKGVMTVWDRIEEYFAPITEWR